MIVVSDTGPLNYLVQIERIDLLPALYERVVIPPAVLIELTAPGAPTIGRRWAAALPEWVSVRTPSGTWGEKGEQWAIALAHELDCPLLCDDKPARRQAAREGLLVTGILGVLQQAGVLGMVDLPRALERLVGETNFRVDESLVARVIREAEAIRRRDPI